MSVFVSEKVYRNGLEYLKTNAIKVVINSVLSTDYATVAETVANQPAKSDIDTSKTTITANTGAEGGFSLEIPEIKTITVDRAGTYKQVAVYDDVNKDILVIALAQVEHDLSKDDIINLDPIKVTLTKAS